MVAPRYSFTTGINGKGKSISICGAVVKALYFHQAKLVWFPLAPIWVIGGIRKGPTKLLPCTSKVLLYTLACQDFAGTEQNALQCLKQWAIVLILQQLVSIIVHCLWSQGDLAIWSELEVVCYRWMQLLHQHDGVKVLPLSPTTLSSDCDDDSWHSSQDRSVHQPAHLAYSQQMTILSTISRNYSHTVQQ